MEFSAGFIFWGLMISTTGVVFIRYGKKNADLLAAMTGLVLMAYPYFISSLGWNIFAGLAIIAGFFLIRRFL